MLYPYLYLQLGFAGCIVEVSDLNMHPRWMPFKRNDVMETLGGDLMTEVNQKYVLHDCLDSLVDEDIFPYISSLSIINGPHSIYVIASRSSIS